MISPRKFREAVLRNLAENHRKTAPLMTFLLRNKLNPRKFQIIYLLAGNAAGDGAAEWVIAGCPTPHRKMVV